MSPSHSFKAVQALTLQLSTICEGILFRAGPFLKEGIYQDLLVHELSLLGYASSREVVFNYKFQDSQGKDLLLGNNQCLRSDVELPTYGGIIEVKSSTSATKAESVWQLRNYLEQRPDRSWGAILNFTSKFGTRSAPKVQCDTLYKISQFPDIHVGSSLSDRENTDIHSNSLTCNTQGTDGNLYSVNRYFSERIVTKDYPLENKVILTSNDSSTKTQDEQ